MFTAADALAGPDAGQRGRKEPTFVATRLDGEAPTGRAEPAFTADFDTETRAEPTLMPSASPAEPPEAAQPTTAQPASMHAATAHSAPGSSAAQVAIRIKP